MGKYFDDDVEEKIEALKKQDLATLEDLKNESERLARMQKDFEKKFSIKHKK